MNHVINDAGRHLEEEWRHMYGLENWYLVSNNGRVISIKRNDGIIKELRISRNKDGRPVFNARYGGKKGFTKFVATAVLETFGSPRPDNMEVCHNDGDVSNSNIKNLRWDTRQNNRMDAIRHGTAHVFEKGSKHPLSKLKEHEIKSIKRLLFPTKIDTYAAIGRKFNVSESTISYIHKGKLWKHIQI